ncbi:MAG: Tol-Pal system protein TolB, partial [Pseudomonadota bacterium]|nr:Tol-Pal system protein TolB [Pseudomonadota bacterium]
MFRKLILTALLGLLGTWHIAMAQLEVVVDRADLKPTPIAIPNFEAIGVDPETAQLISDVIRSDLESTGLFTITPQEAFIQNDLNIEVAPRFADWKIIQTDALVVGTVEQITRDGNDLIRGSVRMWDVYGEELMRFEDSSGRQVSGRRFTT